MDRKDLEEHGLRRRRPWSRGLCGLSIPFASSLPSVPARRSHCARSSPSKPRPVQPLGLALVRSLFLTVLSVPREPAGPAASDDCAHPALPFPLPLMKRTPPTVISKGVTRTVSGGEASVFFFPLFRRKNVNNHSNGSSNSDNVKKDSVPFSAMREVILIVRIIASV